MVLVTFHHWDGGKVYFECIILARHELHFQQTGRVFKLCRAVLHSGSFSLIVFN